MRDAELQMQRAMAQATAREQAGQSSYAMAAYREAQAEWAKAQQKIKDARAGKITAVEPPSGTVAGAVMTANGSQGGQKPCPQIGGLASEAECTSYSGLLSSLQQGIAAFDPPRQMDMGRDYPVRLVIGSREVSDQVVDTATDAGDVKTVDIRLGSWICAELMASQFKFDGSARQCKERGLSRMLSFNWTVSPRQDGTLKLGVKVESLAGKDGKLLDTIDSRMIAVDVKADTIGRFDMLVSRLTESFGGLRTMLLALLSALGVLSVIIWRIRHIGRKPDKDALTDLTAS